MTKTNAKKIGLAGPVLLALLIDSGRLKTNPMFSWMPVDLTVMLAALVAIFFLTARARFGPASGWIAAPIVLWTFFLIPVGWTTFNSFTITKVVTLFTVTLLLALAPFQLLRDDRQQQAFLIALVAVALLFVAMTFLGGPTYSTDYSNRITVEGANTIGTARVTLAGAIVMVIYAFRRDLKTRTRVLLVAAAMLTSTLGVSTGSRGPVLAAIIATLLVMLVSPLFKKYRGRAILGAAILCVVIVWSGLQSGSDGLSRVLSGSETSDKAREALWSRAVDIIRENPLGVGWGMYKPPGLEHGYPHNIVLEIGAEAGWLQLIIFIGLLIATAVRGAYCARTSATAAFFGLYIFALLNAFVSSDINGTRLLWVAMFAIWVLPWHELKNVKPSKRTPSSTLGPWMYS